ncbi:MAG: PDZ domain-containing protein [Planctomycetes bacterium]|nr:PDZ domain-containing protein [Planctomycetota bacterium]
MIRKRHLILACLLCLCSPGLVLAQGNSFLKTNPKFVEAFREVIAAPSQSTVRVLCDDKDTALGMVVGEAGWILTKSNDLKGAVSVKLADGRVFEARLMGIHKDHDLAMLKIEASNLKPVTFKDSKEVTVGNWVACAGLDDTPVGIGVISVGTRKLTNKGPILAQDLSKAGYLGVGIEPAEGGVRIREVMPNTAAAKAGIQAKDLVLTLSGQQMLDPDEFMASMSKFKPGDVVTMRVRRGEEELELKATLGKRPADMLRGDFQNKMGSELSSRRTGYSTILQHDSIVKPVDCGGPIVDLDGKVIGINICRAGRTESWAIPTEVIQSVLFDLMSGKLAPVSTKTQPVSLDKIAAAKFAVKKAEEEKVKAERRLTAARARLEQLLREQATPTTPEPGNRTNDPDRPVNPRQATTPRGQ